jgi:SAM-dependent methyltransferase
VEISERANGCGNDRASEPNPIARMDRHRPLLPQQLAPGASVLDVGSGSGYLLAVMARMVQPGGRVYGVEHIPEVRRRGGAVAVKEPRKQAKHALSLDAASPPARSSWSGPSRTCARTRRRLDS